MKKCAYCSSDIIMGGKTEGDYHFCNSKCLSHAPFVSLAAMVPDDLLEEYVKKVHEGECPECRGRGPVDLHTSHRVWSALFATSWISKPVICCRSCGTKKQLRAMFLCFFLGWWGFPWGIILTPIQILRNVGEMISGPSSVRPSQKFRHALRMTLAASLADTLEKEMAAEEKETAPA